MNVRNEEAAITEPNEDTISKPNEADTTTEPNETTATKSNNLTISNNTIINNT